MGRTTDLLKAVVKVLNAATLSQEFTATRAYRIDYTAEQLETLRVTVLPCEADAELESRDSVQDKTDCWVAVQKKVDVDDLDAVDPLTDLVDEVVDLFLKGAGARPADAPWARCTAAKHTPHFDQLSFHELRQFASALRLTFEFQH